MDEQTRDHPVLTRQQFLAEYNFPDSTERKRRSSGNFAPHFSIGRRIYYRRKSVEAWIASRETGSNACSHSGGGAA
ncbi:helix-turn-helix transcriptional regulator [Antrihabitans spumae]|uniref:Helix-turn-helix transcriptional regulator n=1 Tax=Antrihabitans spumae TaxID=3373370 RepID=A0ABW7KHY2_9NOCA